jgi:hypothetical protein
MIADKNRVFDGWLSMEGGVDAGRLPDTLDINQSHSALNMTFRGGTPSTRPGWRKLGETFPQPLTKQKWCFNTPRSYPLPAPARDFIEGEYKPDNIPVGASVTIGTCTFAREPAHPANITVSTAHNLVEHDIVKFTTTGTLPGGILLNHEYYVLAQGLTATKLRISATDGGPPINFIHTGTGVHTILKFVAVDTCFTNENSQYIYKHGILQSAIAYSPHNGEDCIMAMIGGRLFRVIPGVTGAKVTEVIVQDENRNLRNRFDTPIAYMCQADKWLIVQDGLANAIIYNASKARRAKVSVDVNNTEIPTGTIMAYGMGRLVVIVNKRDVAFGDLHGSHDLPDPADSLILFTERNFLAEGFDAAIPFTQGIATGMIFFPQLDTSTGNGQLMCFAERGATSFFLSLDRLLWKTSSFQILALLTTGMRGHRTISVVNEDLWFRSDDGVRSYRQARSDSERYNWSHVPLSTNVKQFLGNDSDWLLKYGSSMYFDNRILMTTSPMWNDGRPCHGGMVVVDFDVISSFSGSAQAAQVSKPAWEGQWYSEQFLPTQLLTGTFNGATRAFAFGLETQLDDNGVPFLANQLFELSVSDKDDYDDHPIPWELVTRSFDFNKLDPQSSTVFTENELYDADIWLKDIVE